MTMAENSMGSSTRKAVRDLSGPAAVLLAFAALSLVAWLDLTDEALGPAFSVGFVLVAVTAPMAVTRNSLVTTGALPPILLIVTLWVVVLIAPEAVTTTGLAADAGSFARTLAATLDHGMTLVVGHGLALAAIAVRATWGVKAAQR